jgi:hypothetical protein
MMRVVKGIMLLTVCAAVAGLTTCAQKNPVENTTGGIDVEPYQADDRGCIPQGADNRNIAAVYYAIVYGDGYGRPNRVEISYEPECGTFSSGLVSPPTSVELKWPWNNPDPVVSTAITTDDLHTVTVLYDPAMFVSGYTHTEGNGRGIVRITGGEGEGDFFETLDGIGPILADGADGIGGRYSPILIENLYPDVVPDTLIIHVSENIGTSDVAIAALKGANSIVYWPPSDARPALTDPGTPLNVMTAFYWYTEENSYAIVLAPGSPRPVAGGWIRFNPANTTIKDMAGHVIGGYIHPNNSVQPDNRWVRLVQKMVQPQIDSAWYTSDPMTGLRDYVYIAFNKNVDVAAWFSGGYFKFGTHTVAVPAAGVHYITLLNDSRTIRIDLALAGWPQTSIVTSGVFEVVVGFTPVYDWGPIVRWAMDRAKPVLVDKATLIKGAPDTLVVIYSEQLSDASLYIMQPIVIYKENGIQYYIPALNYLMWDNVRGTSYQRVTYIVEDDLPDDIKSGDSVNINILAGVSDWETPPNYQDLVNRNVPLEVKYQSSSVNWNVRVKNNPFRSGSSTTVEISPGVKGATVWLKYSVRLYDDLGNIVIYDKNIVGWDIAEWSWDGYNNKGRVAGTGTYLFTAVCDAEVLSADKQSVEQRERYVVTRAIGFVR